MSFIKAHLDTHGHICCLCQQWFPRNLLDLLVVEEYKGVTVKDWICHDCQEGDLRDGEG